MKLLVDIGNSRIKWGIWKNGALDHCGAFTRPDAANIPAGAEAAWGRMPPPRNIITANVAGETIAAALTAWMQSHWNITPHFIQAQARAGGVTNAYEEPGKLGVDRWAALVATRRRYQQAACIVNAGTAITIDAMDENGHHLGGLIVPGVQLMRSSLLEKTADISARAQGQTVKQGTLLARSTQAAVQGGTLYSAVALIDRIAQDLATQLGPNMARLISGGDAASLHPLLTPGFEHRPHLVLEGLAILGESPCD